MKVRKIVLASTGLLLAIGAAFIGRASAKFTAAPNLYYSVPGVQACAAVLTGTTPVYFSTLGTTQASIVTTGGSTANLYYTANCGATKKVFFHA